MGVVRDVTVEQLAQAIGGIDTSGLAKDTTLQATNTALGNINTTLGGITTNDPPTDTTQQSIVAAINNLLSALTPSASNISFTNTGTDLTATNVQGLGVELNNKINGLVKKSSVSLIFDTSGRSTIQLNMGRIIAIDFKTTSYTYTLRYLNASNTLIYLRNPDTLALITNDNNPILADIYYI